jgi:hypothetical protein
MYKYRKKTTITYGNQNNILKSNQLPEIDRERISATITIYAQKNRLILLIKTQPAITLTNPQQPTPAEITFLPPRPTPPPEYEGQRFSVGLFYCLYPALQASSGGG